VKRGNIEIEASSTWTRGNIFIWRMWIGNTCCNGGIRPRWNSTL